MNVLIVAQCSKGALVETRRILDQFAERRGDRTWQTAITQQGLATVRQLLRKTARRNTAVACHWIKGPNQTELLWIVGNLRRFNEDGAVPTNMTRRDVIRAKDENQWHSAEVISLLAGVAGLFHDFGKANRMFQAKLLPGAKKRTEPYRHEWVSLRIFQAFVGDKQDEEWVDYLTTLTPADELDILSRIQRDGESPPVGNPFRSMPLLARAVGWLIVSHHRLPQHAGRNGFEPKLKNIDEWMTGKRFDASWNSPQCELDIWGPSEFSDVWKFDDGTPFRSDTWRRKARAIGSRMKKHTGLFNTDWLADPFSIHLSRVALMLADHSYSAGDPVAQWQDQGYAAFANTDRKSGALKQKLDEHNVGVGHNAVLVAKALPKLRESLPSITRHRAFSQRSTQGQYRWQDSAFELAQAVRSRSTEQGFFGVNMASTGTGKTFANARIMYGLSDSREGCRFSVALGLRTLTLQTGEALQARLKLDEDDLAVVIGSAAVKELHALNWEETPGDDCNTGVPLTHEEAGSESAGALFAEHQYVRYEGSLDDGRLSSWLASSPMMHRLVSAPILVSTIDHLIPATEGHRGGRQIAPMLRLMTSDLVLDEPDDFELPDMPALTRLVNWAGLLGSRVLLSSATLPPSLVEALFDAYCAGREKYNAVRGRPDNPRLICCAWFDEFRALQSDHGDLPNFTIAHEEFIRKRVLHLSRPPSRRWAEVVRTEPPSAGNMDVAAGIAETVLTKIYDLHDRHHQRQEATGRRVSIGLVRMANINPMVAVAQNALRADARDGYCIHFCIYHARHPLMIRSRIEFDLDSLLQRYDPDRLWSNPSLCSALNRADVQNHIFVVFGTAVTEVGRDHDYDWAIAEPSSMRSLIQLAGRVKRHRDCVPDSPNFFILNKNFNAYVGRSPAYLQPGFEGGPCILASKDMADVLMPEQYRSISAIPRIQQRADLDPSRNLVDLEHVRTRVQLFGLACDDLHASLWWRRNINWSSELQRRSPFRPATGPEDTLVLYMEDEDAEPAFHQLSESGELFRVDDYCFERPEIPLGARIHPWIEVDAKSLIKQLADRLSLEPHDVSRKFGVLTLSRRNRKWHHHSAFGVYMPMP